MKKLGLIFKEASEKRIKNYLKESSAVFILKYSGLTGLDLNILRQSLKNSNASLFVVKNSVARRALSNSAFEPLLPSIEGPCGIVFAKEEPVATSRVICNFSKDHQKMVLEGGFFDNKLLAKQDVEAIAKLPSKEVLRAQVVMTLNSPISGFARVLNQVLRKFVYCLDQIKQKKTG